MKQDIENYMKIWKQEMYLRREIKLYGSVEIVDIFTNELVLLKYVQHVLIHKHILK